MESVCVRALDLEIRFRCLSDRLSPPLRFSSIFNQSGMTMALISSCTVMSLSAAIFRSFVYAKSPRDCMNLDESVTLRESCRYYLPDPQLCGSSCAPYKAECSHHTPTNLLRHRDTSRYTIQAQRVGRNIYRGTFLSAATVEVSPCLAGTEVREGQSHAGSSIIARKDLAEPLRSMSCPRKNQRTFPTEPEHVEQHSQRLADQAIDQVDLSLEIFRIVQRVKRLRLVRALKRIQKRFALWPLIAALIRPSSALVRLSKTSTIKIDH